MNDTTTKKHHVPTVRLREELAKSKQQGRMTKELGLLFMQLAENAVAHPWYRGYSYREDFVARGVMACCETWHKFDQDKLTSEGTKTSPLSYFMTVCQFAFRDFLEAEKKQTDIRDRELVFMGLTPSRNSLLSSDDITWS